MTISYEPKSREVRREILGTYHRTPSARAIAIPADGQSFAGYSFSPGLGAQAIKEVLEIAKAATEVASSNTDTSRTSPLDSYLGKTVTSIVAGATLLGIQALAAGALTLTGLSFGAALLVASGYGLYRYFKGQQV